MKNLITTNSGIAIVVDKTEARVSHKDIAAALNLESRSMMRLLTDNIKDFEELGLLRFKNAIIKGRGQPERIAYLNEDQSFLLLSYSRNTETVRRAKVRMVKAFKAAREALTQHETQYLPMHHACHDSVRQIAMHARAQGSTTPEAMFHMNIEKLINKVFGLQVNTRHMLTPQVQTQVSMAYSISASCCDHVLKQGLPANDAYALVKPRVEQLANMMRIERLGEA